MKHPNPTHQPRRTLGRPLRGSRVCAVQAASPRRRPSKRERGMALVVVMSVIAVLTIYLSEMMQNNATSFHVAISQRDKLKAEYVARSAQNLTRLLIANEPQIRKQVGPFYRMLLKRSPPQLNVWAFSNELLQPFFSPTLAAEGDTGIDFSAMRGVTEIEGSVEVIAVPENAKINVSDALFLRGNQAKESLALQLFTLMGGGVVESPYDPLFEQEDADGQFTTRLDVVAAIIDWWDLDQQRTIYDPGAGTIASSGSEDDSYSQLRDPYRVKNAPYDSLEELRLIRGVGDDFWVNFVESDPTDPRTRKLTVYASGRVNPNEAPPAVLLARLCSFVPEQPLCSDATQGLAFISLFNTARAIVPLALFSRPADFLDFVQGKTDNESAPYTMLLSYLSPDNPLMQWTPLEVPDDIRKDMMNTFITSAAIFIIQSTGRVGNAEVRLSSVVNFDAGWSPPPPIAGKMPVLGVFHHYRVN